MESWSRLTGPVSDRRWTSGYGTTPSQHSLALRPVARIHDYLDGGTGAQIALGGAIRDVVGIPALSVCWVPKMPESGRLRHGARRIFR